MGSVSAQVGLRRTRAWLIRGVAALAASVLLYWAFRAAPLLEIGRALRQITVWQVLLIIILNVLFHALMGLRWWIVARADLRQVRLAEMIVVRLSAFGLSYFTPGPQVGGEPLQVQYLRRRWGATFARSTATVIMDRLLELLAGFVFLVLGVTILLRRQGLLSGIGPISPAALAGMALLLAWPVAHIALLRRGKYPISALVRRLGVTRRLRKVMRLVQASEHLAGRFCQRRPRALLAALGVSALVGVLAVMEYGFITSFLDMNLSFWQIVAGWTAGWISFLFPLPGGLGALEASQVIALGAFGVAGATALGAVLLLRARDLAFGGLGIALAARYVHFITKSEAPFASDGRTHGSGT
ncbi:MAG: lysylphosphatidylglycerol synthase transmembrane domain-containing protein [Chloroflexota bacterium]